MFTEQLCLKTVCVIALLACQVVVPQGGDGFAGPSDWVTLIVNNEIQQELKLDGDQRLRAAEISETYRSLLRQFYADFEEQEPVARKEARQAKVDSAKADTEKRIEKILKAEEFVRLKQISLQVRGGEALFDDTIASRLSLTTDQRAQLKKAREKNDAEHRKMEEMLKRIRFESEEEMEKFKAEYKEAADTRLLAVLTPEQQKRFDEMKGKKLQFRPEVSPGAP